MKKYIEVGNRLRQLRAHLSQKEFSEKINVPLTTYQRYESGERLPKGDVLHRIASIFDVPVEWLMTGSRVIEKTDEQIRDIVKASSWRAGIQTTKEQEDESVRIYKEALSRPTQVYDRIVVTEQSPFYPLHKQLERVLREGNKTKIEAVVSLLNTFDPGIKEAEELKKGAA